jgi:hypothetical protein
VGLDSDLVNNGDLGELMSGAEQSAAYLWTNLTEGELIRAANELRQALTVWDQETIQEIERAINGFFSDDELETHLRPTLEHIVSELQKYFARKGIKREH